MQEFEGSFLHSTSPHRLPKTQFTFQQPEVGLAGYQTQHDLQMTNVLSQYNLLQFNFIPFNFRQVKSIQYKSIAKNQNKTIQFSTIQIN